MKIISGISSKVLVIAFVVIVVALVALMALVAPQAGTNPGTTQTTTPPDVVTIDNPVKATDYPYIGIKNNDTLVVANVLDKSLVISLDHRKWTQATWSPDGKTIVAEGRADIASAKPIYDLYAYTLSTNTWTRLTFFGDDDTGVTGYAWRPDGTLVFTQGVDPNDFVHSYNLQSSELTKLFRVGGSLQMYSGDSGLFVIKANVGSADKPAYNFDLYKADGTILQSFTSQPMAVPPVRLLNIYRGRTTNEFLISKLIDKAGNSITYQTWSLDNPKLTDQILYMPAAASTTSTTPAETPAKIPLAYIPLCPVSDLLYSAYVYANPADGFDVISFPFVSDSTSAVYSTEATATLAKAIAVDSTKISCGKTATVLPVTYNNTDGPVTSWYVYASGRIAEQPVLKNYAEVTVQ